MRSGVRPHDHDRTAESMEGVRMGFGPHWRGVGLQHKEGFYGYPVNRWSIKRPPNGTKLDRRSTSGTPRPLGKPRAIPRRFNTRTRKEVKEGAGEHGSARLHNGQRGKCSDA